MAKEPKSISVTYEDQQNINAFSKLHSQSTDLQTLIRAKKKLLEDLEDATNELMLADDEEVYYAVGECFVHIDKDAAEQKLDQRVDEVKSEIAEAEIKVNEFQHQLKQLKSVLYGKFGNSINLDE